MVYRSKKHLGSLLILLISLVLCALLCAVLLSVTAIADVSVTDAAEGDMIYWGVTEDNRLIISTNESYVSSYAVDGQQGSFASNTNFTIALIPWNSYKSAITDIQVESGVKPTSTGYWFEGCSNATSFDLSGLDTSSVTNMTNMFKNCSKIESLDLSYFNTTSVQTMSEMFSGCSSLKSVDLTSFNTRKTVNFNYMFNGCNTLESLDLSKFEIVGFLTTVSYMLVGCSNLETIVLPTTIERRLDLPGTFWDGSQNINSVSANTELTKKTLIRHDPHNYVDGVCSLCGDIQPIYWGITAENKLIISTDEADTDSAVEGKSGNFASDTVFTTATASVPWGSFRSTITDVQVHSTVYPTSTACWFYYFSSVTNVDLSGLDTTNVTDMSNMFNGCSSLISLNLSSFDMTNVLEVSDMLKGCDVLNEIALPQNIGEEILLPSVFHYVAEHIDYRSVVNAQSGLMLFRHDDASVKAKYKVDAVAPTCTEEGYSAYYHCGLCGKYYKDSVGGNELIEISGKDDVKVSALGHAYGEWIIDTPATCTEKGSRYRVCANDGTHIESEEINALGHDFGEWIVTKEPTVDEYGEETRVCLHDGTHVEKRQIDKLPAPEDPEPIEPAPTPTPEQPIEAMWIVLIVVLAVFVLAEIAFLIYYGVRKHKATGKTEEKEQ